MLFQAQILKKSSRVLRLVTIATARGIRTRSAPQRIPRSLTLDNNQSKQQSTTFPAPEILQKEAQRRNMEKLDVQQDALVLDMLNNSKPGSKMDRRFQEQKQILASLTDEDEKVLALAMFLVNEIKYEMFEPEDFSAEIADEGDAEMFIEYELRQFLTSSDDWENKRYLKFKILNQIMERLIKQRNGLLVFPPQFTVEIFQLSQFILDDEELRLTVRYWSGKLVYSLNKFEFDFLSESQFIEALILKGENSYANELLVKKADKVNQRFWYELMIVNDFECSDLKHANEKVELVKEKCHTEYLDSRIFHLFIDKACEMKDDIALNSWIDRYLKLIVEKGGFTFVDQENDQPQLNLSEEEALALLTEEQQPKTEDFIKILEILLKENDSFNPQLTSRLIDFYLSQPKTHSMDLVPVLFESKFQFKTKILPVLIRTENPKVPELIKFFDDYRKDATLETSQSDFLEELLKRGVKSSKLQRISEAVEKHLESEGKLSSSMAYHLIQNCLRGGKVDESFEILNQMESASSSPLSEQSILPPVESKHYLPFLAHFGKHGDSEKFHNTLLAFSSSPKSKFAYNPIILTQVISSITKMKDYDYSIELIKDILINDIHRSDQNYVKSEGFRERKFYAAIWKSVQDSLFYARANPEKVQKKPNFSEDFPNLRLLFMKMIHDKVVPNVKDYNLIISCFLLNRDRYSVTCVLKYMCEKHGLSLSPEVVKLLLRYNGPHTHQETATIEGETTRTNSDQAQTRVLNSLHLQSRSSSTLDPFAPKSTVATSPISNESVSLRDKPLIDIDDTPAAPKSKTVDINYNWEYHYYLIIKSIMDHRNSKRFNFQYCASVFKDFELIPPSKEEINTLFSAYDSEIRTVGVKKNRKQQQTKRITGYKGSQKRKNKVKMAEEMKKEQTL